MQKYCIKQTTIATAAFRGHNFRVENSQFFLFCQMLHKRIFALVLCIMHWFPAKTNKKFEILQKRLFITYDFRCVPKPVNITKVPALVIFRYLMFQTTLFLGQTFSLWFSQCRIFDSQNVQENSTNAQVTVINSHV